MWPGTQGHPRSHGQKDWLHGTHHRVIPLPKGSPLTVTQKKKTKTLTSRGKALRERRLRELEMRKAGMTYAQIAQAVGVSIKTVFLDIRSIVSPNADAYDLEIAVDLQRIEMALLPLAKAVRMVITRPSIAGNNSSTPSTNCLTATFMTAKHNSQQTCQSKSSAKWNSKRYDHHPGQQTLSPLRRGS